MATIWKFPLQITDKQIVKAPGSFRPLCVMVQGGQLCLWAVVDKLDQQTNREVSIVGTGNPVPKELSQDFYLGSVQQGPFVWHVFTADQPISR